jgi:methyl-accepting chemotaxis protein
MLLKNNDGADDDADTSGRRWETFKDGLYDFVEKKTFIKDKTVDANAKSNADQIANDAKSTVIQGETGGFYTNAVEFTKPTPPAAKFLEQQKAQASPSPVKKKNNIAPGERIMKQYTSSTLEEGSLPSYVTASSPAPPPTTFNNANPINPTVNISNEKEDFVSNIQNDMAPKSIAEGSGIYDADLNSRNPLKEIRAKLAIKADEYQRNRRLAAAKRKTQINNIKEIIFSILDTVETMYEKMMKLPSEIEQNVEGSKAVLEDFNAKAQSTLDDIQETPAKVQNAVDQTKLSVQETQRKTMEIIGEVQSIPSKVLKVVDETQQKLENTRENVQKAVDDTQQSFENTKVNVEKLVAKVDDLTSRKKESSISSHQAIRPPATKSLADIDPDLDTEVAQALQVAKDALSLRPDISSSDGDNKTASASPPKPTESTK